MPEHVILLSVPGLRAKDLAAMPNLRALAADEMTLVPSFPCVTCPVQANMTTGKLPSGHGVVANGFYWRDKRQVEMWTAWNETIAGPQIWDVLHDKRPGTTSAVWFPLLSKGCGADYICTPAPIHNPDGSESLWCYTRPTEMYGQLRERLGHFPLVHFWGPLANIQSTSWIADSAVDGARQFRPNFFYIYLPHLDYAVSTFLEDLYARGLDRHVLFIFCGEFGRTPRIEHQDASRRPGRDHWPRAMSVFLAGGGLRMGQVIGQTNRRGEEPIQRIMDSNCLLATLYHRFGIDTQQTFTDRSGRPLAILPEGAPITELL